MFESMVDRIMALAQEHKVLEGEYGVSVSQQGDCSQADNRPAASLEVATSEVT